LCRSEDSSRGFRSASGEAGPSEEFDCVEVFLLDSTRGWLSAGISTARVEFGALEGSSASLLSSPDSIFSNQQFAGTVDAQADASTRCCPVCGGNTALINLEMVLPDLLRRVACEIHKDVF